MRNFINATRIFLGFLFLIFGLNGFYTFIPVPDFHPFMKILVSSGYIYLVKTVEVVAGILLLSNRLVPLALVMLIPDAVNIAAYHLLLDSRNWFMAPLILVLISILCYAYKSYFIPLFTYRAEADIPDSS